MTALVWVLVAFIAGLNVGVLLILWLSHTTHHTPEPMFVPADWCDR